MLIWFIVAKCTFFPQAFFFSFVKFVVTDVFAEVTVFSALC